LHEKQQGCAQENGEAIEKKQRSTSLEFPGAVAQPALDVDGTPVYEMNSSTRPAPVRQGESEATWKLVSAVSTEAIRMRGTRKALVHRQGWH
jgi:hypothetical protein